MTSSSIDFEYLRAVVMRNSGNQVDPSRDYLFEARLQRLLRDRGMHSLSQLVSALRADAGPTLQRSVAEAMTINETSFFRDTPTFDLLREQLLPALIERRRDTRTLRFWSAASSSGQEAYSTAMMLRDVNWLVARDAPFQAHVKVRSMRPPVAARVTPLAGGARVELAAPEDSIAPGQACVFYDAPAGQARVRSTTSSPRSSKGMRGFGRSKCRLAGISPCRIASAVLSTPTP